MANGSSTTVVPNVYIQLFIKSACPDHNKEQIQLYRSTLTLKNGFEVAINRFALKIRSRFFMTTGEKCNSS